jgi:hypothetical protein
MNQEKHPKTNKYKALLKLKHALKDEMKRDSQDENQKKQVVHLPCSSQT